MVKNFSSVLCKAMPSLLSMCSCSSAFVNFPAVVKVSDLFTKTPPHLLPDASVYASKFVSVA